jgi:hypothetical protein
VADDCLGCETGTGTATEGGVLTPQVARLSDWSSARTAFPLTDLCRDRSQGYLLAMYTAPTFLSWALAVAPVPPSDTAAPVAYAAPVVEADEYTSPSGNRTRWASATYLLPDGKLAEVFLLADDRASGEAIISVDGEAIASSSFDPTIGVTRWISSEPGTRERAAAAMAAISAGGGDQLLDAFLPDDAQEFPCSGYGKKVLKVAKYLWVAASYAVGGACCIGATAATALGCIACAGAAGVAGHAGTEALDGYCD